MDSIRVQPTAPSDAQQIVEFMKIDFLKNEPLCEALGGIDSEVMDLWMLRMAQSGLSFEAIDTSCDNKRVGVFLCTMYEKGVRHPIEAEVDSMARDENMNQIFDILHELHPAVHSEIFEKRGQTCYLEGTHLSVLSDYGGQGIAGKLIGAVEDKAREMNVNLVYICCSSEFTARAVAKRDFEMFDTYRYDQYSRDGKCIFQPSGPHVGLKSYIKVLSQ